jgi:Domain of unknown function (DUF4783)
LPYKLWQYFNTLFVFNIPGTSYFGMFLDNYNKEDYIKHYDMKKLLHITGFIFTVLILVSYTLLAPIDEVVSAMKNGNAGLLSKYFDQTVEIGLPDRSDSYSKAQAEVVLKDFFQTKGVTNFDPEHRSDNNGSLFCIGTLNSKNGNFRTTIYMKTRSDKQLIQEIRIENKR